MDPSKSILPKLLDVLSWLVFACLVLGAVGSVITSGSLAAGLVYFLAAVGSFFILRGMLFALVCLLDTRNAVMVLAEGEYRRRASEPERSGSGSRSTFAASAGSSSSESTSGRRYVVGPDGQVVTRTD